jgi:hypothetical protein
VIFIIDHISILSLTNIFASASLVRISQYVSSTPALQSDRFLPLKAPAPKSSTVYLISDNSDSTAMTIVPAHDPDAVTERPDLKSLLATQTWSSETQILFPDDQDFVEATIRWNSYSQPTYKAAVRPGSPQDVQSLVSIIFYWSVHTHCL